MAPVGQSNSGPAEELKIAIYEAFGSVDEMKKTFTDAALARFGSGWAWLGVKPDGSLGITSTANQGKPWCPEVAFAWISVVSLLSIAWFSLFA